METINFNIVSSNSSVEWTGRKVTGAHNGTIGIKNGNFIFNDGKINGGNIVIDTTSIKILDVTDPATNAQFAGHLASDDFFSIEKLYILMNVLQSKRQNIIKPIEQEYAID